MDALIPGVGALCAIGILLMIILLPASLRKVDATENALAYDTIWCSLDATTLGPGLHNVAPFSSILRWPSTYQTVEYSSTKGTAISCNSADGIRIGLDISFQYQPDSKKIYDLTMLYQDFESYEKILKQAGRSAIRHSCGHYTAQEFQTKRKQIGTEMHGKMKAKMESMKSVLVDVQLRNVARPSSYEAAVQSKEAARTDITLAESQKSQEMTIAQTVKLDADLAANRTQNLAKTQATITLKQGEYDRDAITDRYSTWASTYKKVMDAQNLTPEGILAYIGNRLVGSPGVTVAMEAPAKTSWQKSLATTAQDCNTGAKKLCTDASKALKTNAASIYCAGSTCSAQDVSVCCS